MMKMASVKAALPSRKVSNDDIVALIEQHSRSTFSGNLGDALHKIRFYLGYAGSDVRHWLGETETPLQLLRRATDEALEEAGLRKDDVDLLIYTGIGRGFIEPGGAYHTAAALDIKRAHCFDVLDACMSWTRALHVVSSFFQAKTYKTALLVNAEFNMCDGGAVYPAVFKLPDLASIEWSFPAYTLGEAASAAVLTADSDDRWSFAFSSRPDLADLCNVPLPGYQGYCRPSDRVARNGVGRFTSFGFDLHLQGNPEAIDVFRRLDVPTREIEAVFTHASSKREWDNMAESVGIRDRLWHTYPYSGNVVSASIPVGIASAVAAGRVKRGDRVAGWVGSAGMSFGAFSFVY
jgi:3-oxoacyl-[acyl-carrier-protein] synthase III